MNCLVCQTDVPADSTLHDLLQRCPTCGFVFYPSLPSAEEIRQLYQTAYFVGSEYVNYLEDCAVLQRNFRLRIKELLRFPTAGRLYEIGAAYGFFLDLAREHWQVEGIDVAEEACRYAREALALHVACGDFLEAPLTPESYDLFCMWDTIEHLREPDRYLGKIARCLRPGGHLALTTGDIGSGVARLQGRRWRLIHPPTHLHYFSASTMEHLLDRYGFDIVHLSHPGFYRSLGTMVRWLLVSLGERGRRVYDRFMESRWAGAGIYLNLYDIMFVIARKRGATGAEDGSVAANAAA